MTKKRKPIDTIFSPYRNFFLRTALTVDLLFLNGKYPAVSQTFGPKMIRRMVAPLRKNLLNRALRADRRWARDSIQKISELSELYEAYRRQSRSGGVEPNDYFRLYAAVREHKPLHVLECGTGLTTTAIGCALKHNAEEDGVFGHLVSMEEGRSWYDHALSLLPMSLEQYVSITLSPKVEKQVEGLRGVCYKTVPARPYELMFIDGPTESSPDTGEVLFDMDILFVRAMNARVRAVIDHRLNSIVMLRRALMRTHHVVYSPVTKFGYIFPK